jgi:hypothetical protein
MEKIVSNLNNTIPHNVRLVDPLNTDDKEDDSVTCHSKRTKAFSNCWMGAYIQTVYQRNIDDIDSDNAIALTVHIIYTPSDLSFISFSTAVFPGKNTTNCLTIHDLHSPEHQIKFVLFRGIVFWGDGIPQLCACGSHCQLLMAQYQKGAA